MKDSEWLFGKKLPKELKKDSYDTAILTMPEGKPKDFPFTNKEKTKEKSSCTCWTGDKDRVTTTNGECVSTLGENCLVDSLYTWKDEDDKVYTNVANRMIQEEALRYAQTSGFTTIIVVQWADLMICKTRWLSIADQGMVNPLMNFGLLFETILGSLMCYFTPLGAALNTRPLRFSHWFPGMPFCIFIFLYDECRKWLMRKTEKAEIDEGNTLKKLGGWLKENTYY
jgi:sodium/potassium-transporting ATPase subunit alpha